ncbi:MAG: LytTR family DNA-binding domain-containing protein [Bacteroides sp.]
MNKIKAVIIEDEIPAARLLHQMLAALRPDWDIETLPGNIESSVTWFATHHHPDLLFLDIQLTDGNSFVLVERARPQSRIVFTTAYDEYAVQAFAVNSIDYLLKPIHEERLADTLARFEQLAPALAAEAEQQHRLLEVLQTISVPGKKFRTRFLIACTDKMLTLQVSDIAYFYSESKLTFAVTRQAKEHLIDLPLDKLAEQLDPDRFFRANRQTLLSIDAIARIEPYFLGKAAVHVVPPFKEKILISKEKMSAFKQWLNY